MKRSIFGLLIISIFLSSCKDDDENNNPPSGGDPMQPTSGSVSATINGNDFSGEDNVSRYLSYGDFIIKSSDNGSFLNFQIDNFIGNANYSLITGLNNSAEYITTVNGELISFQSISGELTVTEYNESSKTFSASFNITFASVADPSITITGEGTYSGLSILEMLEPSSGEATVFYKESEYFSFEDSAVRYLNNALNISFLSDGGQLSIEALIANNAPDAVTIDVEGEDFFFLGSEIITYQFDENSSTVTGHFKNLDTDDDIEIRFSSIPVSNVDGNPPPTVILNYNGQVINLEDGFLVELQDENNPTEYQYLFQAGDDGGRFVFLNQFDAVDQGLNQTISGFGEYSVDGENQFFEFGLMTIEEGVLPNTVNVFVELPQSNISVVGENLPVI